MCVKWSYIGSQKCKVYLPGSFLHYKGTIGTPGICRDYRIEGVCCASLLKIIEGSC